MNDKFSVDIPVKDQVKDMTVQEIWEKWVEDGVDPDEEHVVVEVIHEVAVRVLFRGNLYECLVAASEVPEGGETRFYPATEFDEEAKKLH